jgi:hypothetical protein
LSKKKFPDKHVEMKFNDLTYNIAFVLLVVTGLYTLLYAGLAGILLCTSVALIAAAFIDQFEIVVASVVIFSLFYIFYLKAFLRKLEPFENLDTPEKILDRLAKMKGDYKQPLQTIPNPRLEPAGVYDPTIEGFEDVQPNVPKSGESAESSSAPSKRKDEVNPNQVKEVTSAVENAQNANNVEKEEFQSATNELFKIGKLPSENKNGPMLDSGSTLLKAMESFKPDQINAMTSDTKKLIETQKGLMDMLNQMRPVLADGKELLQTFSGMFGGSGMKLSL